MATKQQPKSIAITRKSSALNDADDVKPKSDRRRSASSNVSSLTSLPFPTDSRRQSTIDRLPLSRVSSHQMQPTTSDCQPPRLCASCDGKGSQGSSNQATSSFEGSSAKGRHGRFTSVGSLPKGTHNFKTAMRHAASKSGNLALDACAICGIGMTAPLMAPEYALMAVGGLAGFPIGCIKTLVRSDEKKSFQGLRQAKRGAGYASFAWKGTCRIPRLARDVGGSSIKRLERSGRMTRETGDKLAIAFDPASKLLPEAPLIGVDPARRYCAYGQHAVA